jgi:hypothetical protein
VFIDVCVRVTLVSVCMSVSVSVSVSVISHEDFAQKQTWEGGSGTEGARGGVKIVGVA